MATTDKILNPGGLEWAMAHAPAGSDTSSVIEGFRAAGYAINIPGYREQDQPRQAAGALGRAPSDNFGTEALTTVGAGAALDLGLRAKRALANAQAAKGAAVSGMGVHPAVEEVAAAGAHHVLGVPKPLVEFGRRLLHLKDAAAAPTAGPPLPSGPPLPPSAPPLPPSAPPLGGTVGMVPERSLPPIEPLRPPIPGNFGGQPLAADMPPAGPPGLSLVPPPEPVPTRPITVAGAPARAPAQTTEPPYTGGRGASGPELARRSIAREAATGGRKVTLGKTGDVIGEVGDEARVAGRNASSLEDLLKRSIEIAKTVPASSRAAVFKTVKAASKFAHEADTSLGGPAMLFFDLLPKSVMDEAVNSYYTIDPRTNKVVRKQRAGMV